MADFLEERLSDLVRFGSGYQDDYEVAVAETSGGQEYRWLVHPFPKRKFDISYLLENDKTYTELQGVYHRAHGRFAGFRVRCYDEWSSNGRVSTPTAFDQPCGFVSTGIYQLRKYYGRDKTAGATGYPYRTIYKPVAGTVLVAVNGVALSSGVAVNATTGQITITPAPLITDAVTAGFEFDFPVRFNTAMPIGQDYPTLRTVDGVELIELLNP